MVKALLFGSIGTVVETSEIQRQSFNLSFKDLGLDWYWNIATYCDLLKEPGGKKRIKEFSSNSLDEATIEIIHSKKEEYFEKFLTHSISPRDNVVEIINKCLENDIKVGFITSTSKKNINSIQNALKSKLDFSTFNIITSIEDVKSPKPCSEVYEFALKKLGLNENNVYAIEDTKANQSAALNIGIKCFFNPGEYALVNPKDNPNYNILESVDSIVKAF